MKIVIACGGTGGHIYPALALAERITEKRIAEPIFIVGKEGLEAKIVGREGYSFFTVSARGLKRKLSYQALSAPFVTLLGFFQAFSVLKKIRPNVVIATGGYVSLPVVTAAFLLKIPAMLLEQNAILGVSNRMLLPLVKYIAVSFAETGRRYPNSKIVVTGNPVRKRIIEKQKKEALRELGLDPNKKVLLVVGGSQGAKSINRLMVEMYPLFKNADFQVLHIAGSRDFVWVKEVVDKDSFSHYKLYDYVFDMAPFYAAADLVLSRAGATAIAEIMARHIPSVLIPFPYAAENHQELNAEILKGEGATEVCLEKGLKAENLFKVIVDIISNDARLSLMSKGCQKVQPIDATDQVLTLLGKLGA
ncbi:MAG: undecaprenyldiphospho-muramoylpentapeptide beta-N-acetylglucosaminyltransferase [Candidatus Saganbacteria bacterium]|nr:undecaprenyldiphospho-muramoylpentapeptide beta-N-acetylglucosaminyltransferase [Candidatus Saganbacteria bacterium]